jgi:hypothetical protein
METGTYRMDCTRLRKRMSAFPVQTNGAATQALMDMACKEKKSKSLLFASTTSSSCYGSMGMYTSTNKIYSAASEQQYEQHRKSGTKMDLIFAIHALEYIIEEVCLGYLSLLLLVVNMERLLRSLFREFQRVVGDAWEALCTYSFQFEEPLERGIVKSRGDENFPLHSAQPLSFLLPAVERTFKQSNTTMHQLDQQEEDDVILTNPHALHTPLKLITPVATTCTESVMGNDEWGHFADFREQLADESNFIPSCSSALRSSLQNGSSSGLTPLTEVAEADADEEEDWSF